jgi:hypothetical protein
VLEFRPMSEEERLVTKDEIGQLLAGEGKKALGTRSVENYLRDAGIVPAERPETLGRGHKARYRLSEVLKMVEAKRAAEQRQAAGAQAGVALVPQRSQVPTRAEDLAELLGPLLAPYTERTETAIREQTEKIVAAIRETQDRLPELLTAKEAHALTGLPLALIYAALRKGELKFVGKRSPRLFFREDFRAFMRKLQGEQGREYHLSLLTKSPQSANT